MKAIKSYLPLFSGFYYTMFDSEQAEINVLERENLNDDEVEFDYAEYRDRVGVACINSVWNFLKLDDFDINIEFEKIYSPRFYNFSNDDIYCTYKVSEEDFNKLVEYCKTNLSEFKTFLEDRYSSRSGFISFFDTEPEKWFNEYLEEDSDKFEKVFTGILEFYLLNEGYSVDDMLDDVAEETIYIDFEILTNR